MKYGFYTVATRRNISSGGFLVLKFRHLNNLKNFKISKPLSIAVQLKVLNSSTRRDMRSSLYRRPTSGG